MTDKGGWDWVQPDGHAEKRACRSLRLLVAEVELDIGLVVNLELEDGHASLLAEAAPGGERRMQGRDELVLGAIDRVLARVDGAHARFLGCADHHGQPRRWAALHDARVG